MSDTGEGKPEELGDAGEDAAPLEAQPDPEPAADDDNQYSTDFKVRWHLCEIKQTHPLPLPQQPLWSFNTPFLPRPRFRPRVHSFFSALCPGR